MHDEQGYNINMHIRSSPGLQMGLEVAHTCFWPPRKRIMHAQNGNGEKHSSLKDSETAALFAATLAYRTAASLTT